MEEKINLEDLIENFEEYVEKIYFDQVTYIIYENDMPKFKLVPYEE